MAEFDQTQPQLVFFFIQKPWACFIQIHPKERVYYDDEKFREATTKEDLCELVTKGTKGNFEKENSQTVCKEIKKIMVKLQFFLGRNDLQKDD